jgi:hypothetical protein
MLQERKQGIEGGPSSQAEQAGETQEFTARARYSSAGNIPPVQTDMVPPQPTASDLAYGPPHAAGRPGQTARGTGQGGERIGEGASTVEETRVDPILEVDTPHLRFPATVIGSTSTAEVSVRNPDRGAHTLDPTRPVIADPFHDFRVHENSSVVLAPGESRPITVEFSPTRHISSEQAFYLSTDKGVGPQGRFMVSGTGVEAGGKTDAERQALEGGRIADQDFKREELDAQRTNDPNRAKRVAAEHAVAEWKRRAVEYNESLADWTRENYERFLGKTGGDVHFAEPGRIAKFVKWGAVKGAGVLAGPEKKLEEEATKTVVGTFGLKAVDQAVDKYAEWLWEQLTGEEKAPPPEESALQATETMAKKSIAKGRDISSARNAANLVVADSESAARMKIAETSDPAELDGMRSWAESQLARMPKNLDPKDVSLSEELLATWLKERAATPTKANDETNSKAWDKARAELAKSGTLKSLETNDLFIHQCRNEWSRLGLSGNEIEQAAAELDQRRRELETQAVQGGLTEPSAAASLIANTLGDAAYGPIVGTFRHSAHPDVTAAAFAPQQRAFEKGGDDGDFFAGPFSLTCTIHLKTSNAGVYVESFMYNALNSGPRGTYYPYLRRTP